MGHRRRCQNWHDAAADVAAIDFCDCCLVCRIQVVRLASQARAARVGDAVDDVQVSEFRVHVPLVL